MGFGLARAFGRLKPAAPPILLTFILGFSLAACAAGDNHFAYSGTLQADSAAVGSMAGGRIVAVTAHDGQPVTRGQTIVRFDDRQQRAALDGAIAQEAQARAALRDLAAGPRQADIDKAAAAAAQAEALYRRAALLEPQQVAAAQQAVREAQGDGRAAHAKAATATLDLARAQHLFSEGAISAQALDAAREAQQSASGAATAADARLQAAQAQLASVHSGSTTQDVGAAAKAAAAAEANATLVRQGARPDQVAEARAAMDEAGANVAAARARFDETLVAAPADGIVDGLDLHAGDLVPAGVAVATVDEFGDPWVRIYVAQADIGRVKIGASVDARSDAFGSRPFSGSIEAIDSAAQFTPRNVQTASDRADLVFGVKVRLHDPDRLLRAGTTVEIALP